MIIGENLTRLAWATRVVLCNLLYVLITPFRLDSCVICGERRFASGKVQTGSQPFLSLLSSRLKSYPAGI